MSAADEQAVAGECYPLSMVPGLSRLAADVAEGRLPPGADGAQRADGSWYAPAGFAAAPALPAAHREQLAELLLGQNHAAHAGPAAIAHIEQLRAGAQVVVTGQQVGLFGGPLYTLMKAATAVRLAQEATLATGTPHVPLFWLASEDHDYAEVDHVALAGRHELHTLRLAGAQPAGAPVGRLKLGPAVEQALAQAAPLLGEHSPELDLLRRCYRPEATFAGAFAQWLAATFREQGLIVLDASGHACHALGSRVLRSAIEQAPALEAALQARGRELEAAGYTQQVVVGSSLLFLLEHTAGTANPPARLPLKRLPGDEWQAGALRLSTSELLRIADEEPERLSPNALLRPVFQDSILPTAAYIGGPAEIAYWAQASVVYGQLLGRVTPVLPRLSATLVDARTHSLLQGFELVVPDLWCTPAGELAVKMGARSMPVQGKKHLQAAGQALSSELDALTAYLGELDPNLARPAGVAASKMLYQMNRLRRMAARRELERDESIGRRIQALELALYPGRHLQERALGAASALARFGPALIPLLVEAAGDRCGGHKILFA